MIAWSGGRTTRPRDAAWPTGRDALAMANDAWRWTAPPGDPDVAGQGAEFVDLEPNLPGAGVLPSGRRVLLRLPFVKEAALTRPICGRNEAS